MNFKGALTLLHKPTARDVRWSKFVGTGKERNGFFPVSFPFPFFSRSFPRTSLLPASNRRSSLNTCRIQTLQDTTDAQRRELFVAKTRIENKCLMTKISARKVGSRDVRWSKFVRAGKERTRSFPVSFPFPFFPVPFHAHLYQRLACKGLLMLSLAFQSGGAPWRCFTV